MKLENVVILMSDAVTGIAYARELSPFEVNLVVSQLQALDNGALKLIEVEPVILRSKGMSDERAAQLLAMQELTDMRQKGEADGTFKHSGTHQGGTVRVPTLPENLPREWKPAPQCWSCAQPHYLEKVRENDGDCPTCGAEWPNDDE